MAAQSSTASNSNWLKLSKALLDAVTSINTQCASITSDALADDLHKLQQVSRKLDIFTHTTGQPSEEGPGSSREGWHELRNLVGTIIGYCELIDEDLPPEVSSDVRQSLQAILGLCRQLLDTDQRNTRGRAAQLPIISQATYGTILIVDDQTESREVLRRYLGHGQHRILEAGDGHEMFAVLAQENVDLILLDQILPEMDGDELLSQLKQDDALRAIPVIIVSGNKDQERIIRCIEAGAEDYLFKPFDPVLLQARISAGIERKHWHDKEQLYRQELERNQSFIRRIFGRYLSDEIVSTLLEDPSGLEMGGEQRKVTVLMADIRGFSSIAEKLPPQRVVRLLNNYLGDMSDIIMQHHGTVDEFIGDAVLAIFGAPITRENDSDHAIECALAMQAAMTTINSRNRAEQLPEIEMGISINTGPVVAGNIGSEQRAKYGVVGHAVNQTARIGEHCPPGSILISDATLQDCHYKPLVADSHTIKVKGIESAIRIYPVLGGKPAAIEDQSAALKLPPIKLKESPVWDNSCSENSQ